LGRPVFEAEPNKACTCQNDGIALAGVHLAQARVDVSAKHLHDEVGPIGTKRRRSAQTRSSYARAQRKVVERAVARRHEDVAGVFPLWDAGEHKSGRKLARHVLHRVDGEVGAFVEQSLFDLLNEEAFAANLCEGPVLNPIAGRHDLELGKAKSGHRRAELTGERAALGKRQ
jgi:hypothetical protein